MKKFKPNDIIPLIDLTRLNESETPEGINDLCALADQYKTASVCIPLSWVKQARSALKDSKIAVATVANFPSGQHPISTVREEVNRAVIDGADELDLVIPHHELRAGNFQAVQQTISAVRSSWPYKKLKCILETGVLTLDQVRIASEIAIGEGADFLKTSTGKIAQGAEINSFTVMLDVIYTEDHSVGIKVSGGITEYDHIIPFLNKAAEVMGEDWVTAKQFRIGTSQLLYHLTQTQPKLTEVKY